MNTPICDFVREYAKKNAIRLHMPGHKGENLLGFEKYDITEIDGADVLYNANGIIKESQNNASSLFGTEKTLYSTEGSSLCIRAMLYLVKVYALSINQKPVVAAARNAHKVFMTASALLDIDVLWLSDSKNLLSSEINAEYLDKFLSETDEKPVAVYITSPDYLGNISDIKALADVCNKHGVLLLVDNAHGAYLNFLSENLHPIALGAHICCDSAHKTLPALTGGAYLHISRFAPEIFSSSAECAMSLFASTSPSYLILQSLDAVNRYLADGDYSAKLQQFVIQLSALKKRLEDKGFILLGEEKLKITFSTKAYGYTGQEFNQILKSKNIVCEFYDNDFCVLMFTPETEKESLEYLEKVITAIPERESIKALPPKISLGQRRVSMREALFSPSVLCSVEESEGKILARPCVSCPPAIPVAVCGDIITKEVIDCFKYYSITHIYITND